MVVAGMRLNFESPVFSVMYMDSLNSEFSPVSILQQCLRVVVGSGLLKRTMNRFWFV
jgi:hypothetical protein